MRDVETSYFREFMRAGWAYSNNVCGVLQEANCVVSKWLGRVVASNGHAKVFGCLVASSLIFAATAMARFTLDLDWWPLQAPLHGFRGTNVFRAWSDIT